MHNGENEKPGEPGCEANMWDIPRDVGDRITPVTNASRVVLLLLIADVMRSSSKQPKFHGRVT